MIMDSGFFYRLNGSRSRDMGGVHTHTHTQMRLNKCKQARKHAGNCSLIHKITHVHTQANKSRLVSPPSCCTARPPAGIVANIFLDHLCWLILIVLGALALRVVHVLQE